MNDLTGIRLEGAHIAPDGKRVMKLEEYLAIALKHPSGAHETITANASSVLRILGIHISIGDQFVKRTAAWLRANGYRAVAREKLFKIAVVDVSVCPVHVT